MQVDCVLRQGQDDIRMILIKLHYKIFRNVEYFVLVTATFSVASTVTLEVQFEVFTSRTIPENKDALYSDNMLQLEEHYPQKRPQIVYRSNILPTK